MIIQERQMQRSMLRLKPIYLCSGQFALYASGYRKSYQRSGSGLLGKAYLYQEKCLRRQRVLEDLIAMDLIDLLADYSTMFENDNENNIESVFEVQYTDEEGAGFGCLQCSEGNIAVGFNGIRNYTGPTFESGFSFNVPTQEAYDAFEQGDIRRDMAILDIDAWAADTGATFSTGYKHTGYLQSEIYCQTRRCQYWRSEFDKS